MQENSKFQTQLIIGMTISALIGALVGAFSASSLVLGMKTDKGSADSQVDARIVELIEEESATIDVVDQVAPSVVSVVVKKPRGELLTSRYGNTLFFRFSPETTLTQQEADELVEISSGTGFFVSEDGYVLTNKHVVDEPGATFFVVNNDGDEFSTQLIDADPFNDIAILKIDGSGFPPATLGQSEQVRIGQTVIAIGNTLSEFRNTVTKGVVSGINRRVTAGSASSAEVIEEAIQTDAAINPGNSGGPLINLLGEVIGINTAVSAQGESVGFAIPIDQAKRAINDVREFGRIVRPWLGVRYVIVEPSAEHDNNIEYDIGAMIVSGSQPGQSAVFNGSPADLAGIKEGDVMIAIDDKNLTRDEGLTERISAYHPGDNIKITVLRDGVIEHINVTLAEYDESGV